MKRIFLSVIFVIASLISFAHTPEQQCSSPGWYIYIWSYLGNATSVRITWGHGQHSVHNGNGYDTTIKNLNLVPITVFQAPLGQDVTFTFNDGYITDFNVKAPLCNTLPITLTAFTGKDIGNGAIQFKWSVDMESNVDTYQIWELNDYGEHRILEVNSQGDSDIPRTYGAIYQAQTIIESGIPWWVGVCFLVSCIALMIRRTPLKIIGACLAFAMVSCNKTNFNPPVTYSATKHFRLKELDRDGNIYSFDIIQVKIK